MKVLRKVIMLCCFLMLLVGCSKQEVEVEEKDQITKVEPLLVEEDVTSDSEILDEERVDFEIAIEEIIATKLKAINDVDIDLYMTTITDTNRYYYNEQERWFMNMTDNVIRDVDLIIESVEKIDRDTYVANINQIHYTSEYFNFSYPLLFKYEENGWKDYGYHFEILDTGNYLIKYMATETRVDEFKEMIDEAYKNLATLYSEKPPKDFEFKLFNDQEMLRQRSIPANAWLFTGWGEPDESIKIYTGYDPGYKGYNGVIQHEIVHYITINICNNNLATWLLEGIAMYDGSGFYDHSYSGTLSNMTKNGVTMTIDQLEFTDLSSNLSREEIYNFYNASYMYVRYIEETYGRDQMLQIFYEAGKKPFHDSTMNDSFESVNITTTGEVISTVLGLTKEELSEAYLEWLEHTDYFDNRS